MKGPLDRTKVVLRHLPPSITRETLLDQIDTVFRGRYNWVAFRPGKTSQKHQIHARAYINFNSPEDVIGFAEFFDGHIFVNEKGAQYKINVEYAPSQQVPKQWSKKDGREGTILRDQEYMEFLEFLAKPVENLPSAEVQLERREAERSAAAKDIHIVTPLMDFVRQKRASKGATRRSSSNGKPSRRAGKLPDGSPSLSKRNSGKKNSTKMYVLRDTSRNSSSRDKSTYLLVSKRDYQLQTASVPGAEILEENTGLSEITDSGKKKILLLKGKEIPDVKNMMGSVTLKQKHQNEASGRIIRRILVNKEGHQDPIPFEPDNQIQTSYNDKEKRPPRAQNVQAIPIDTNGFTDEKTSLNVLHGFGSDKQERRLRNKDRPDRGVWAPLRRSDGSHASDDSLSSTSLPAKAMVASSEGNSEVRILANRRSSQSSLENGFHKPVNRRGQPQGGKDLDGSPISVDGKPPKRAGVPGYGSYEKQMWVQKSSSGL
ncbi:hypothetical protein SAY86_020161 [Trapa natans]|uniref:UPF3 domain-containing protein n=1 Tax=Trapa natans TaxID=22666 RepID=A0AAN7LYX1_TRANT|nr:hypothetical protein SAY86_020161 [Trapa natans]